MAYLAFDDLGGAALVRARHAAPARPVADTAVAARLSALEWQVVALARGDRLSSLRRPGRMATALRVVFGQPNPMLADARLEALRRIAVLGWHYGYTLPTTELKRFLAAGFSPDQYELVMDSIGTARQRRGQR